MAAIGSKATLYADLASQPARAVYWFCKAGNVPFDLKLTRIGKMEQKSDAFKSINPLQKLPAWQEPDGFCIAESAAIMKFIARTYSNVDDHWYPSDSKSRAQVDQYTHWHVGVLRPVLGPWAFNRIMRPLLQLPPTDSTRAAVAHSERAAPAVLDQLEAWLQGAAAVQRPDLGGQLPCSGVDGFATFLAGTSAPSIADISAVCELTQMEGCAEWSRETLAPYTALQAWLQHMKTLPGYAEAHKVTDIVNHKAVQAKL